MSRKAYLFRHLASHVHEAEVWEILFRKIDHSGFLAAQAAYLQGFAQSSEDLELYALPGAIALGDWDHFLRYALIAINLRDLAEALADSEILAALSLRGQSSLLKNLTAQLADVAQRAAARAVIAAAAQGTERETAIREVLDDLRSLPGAHENGAAAEATLRTLEIVARHLGPDLLREWPSLVGRLVIDPETRSRLWLAMADRCRARGGEADRGFREALRQVEDRQLLLASLPAWLAEAGAEDLGRVREIVAELADPDGALLWTCLLKALSRKVRSSSEAALELWNQQRTEGPAVPWSIALLEAGGPLFAQLDPAGADRLARELSDIALRAAFRVVRLEGQPAPEKAREALQALLELQGDQQLHWMLRVLAAWPEKDSLERRHLTFATIAFLARLRYAAPPADLRRFLDLVADTLPSELRHQIESALWSPAGSPELLEFLVERAESPALLRRLVTSAERYATVVCATEAEAFELRSRILIGLGCRMSLTAEGSKSLAEIAARLLPEERDELYAKVARLLDENGNTEDAGHALREIRSRRHRVTTAFAIQADPPGQEGPFDPAALYNAIANVDFAEDERLAFLALAQPPLDAESLLDTLLMPMRDRERQVQAVVDLARWMLRFEEEFLEKKQRDPLGPRQLVRHALSAIGSDEHLLALAVDLLDLAAPLDLNAQLVEFRETVDIAIINLEQVSWPSRRRALEEILRRVRWTLLRPEASLTHFLAAADLISSIIALADGDESSPGRQRFGTHWDEVLPLVVTAVEHLPWPVRLALEHPLLVRIWGQWLSPLGFLLGWERAWDFLARLREWIIPARLRERFLTPWASGGDALMVRWSWLDEEQKAVISLCFETPERRRERAIALLRESDPSPRSLRALAYLLSTEAPDLVSDLLARLSADTDRDDLCLALIRSGWSAAEHRDRLTSWISGRWHQLAAEVFALEAATGPAEQEGWIRHLAEWVSRCELDPGDPAVWPILRRLRTTPADKARPPLAFAVMDALQNGGRRAGEAAFLVWLNVHLAPTLHPGEEAIPSAERAQAPIQEALSLSRAGGEERKAQPQQSPADQDRQRLTDLRRRWSHAAQRGGKQLRPWLERDKIATLSVLGSTIVLMSLDAVLLGDLWRSPDHPPRLPWQLPALGLPGLFLANALLVDASCGARLEGKPEPARRILRFLLSGIPLFGLYALSLFSWLHRPQKGPTRERRLEIQSGWSRFHTLSPVRLFRKLRDLGGWWLPSSTGLATWFAVNVVFLFVASFGFTRTPGTPAGWMIVSLATLLHVLTFGALASVVWTENRRSLAPSEELVFGIAGSCMVLAPVPLMPFLGQFLVSLTISKTAEQTLVRRARDQSLAARGLPQWLKLEQGLLAVWKRAAWRQRLRRPVVETARDPVEAQWRLLQLGRKKAVLLHFEGAALGWLLLQLGERNNWWIPLLTWLLVVCGSLLLGTGALILTAIRFARRVVGADDQAHLSSSSPYPFLLAASQLSFFSGLCLGVLLREGNVGAIAGLYLTIAGVGLVTLFPPLLLSLVVPVPPVSQRDESARNLWTLGYGGLGIYAAGGLSLPAFRSLSFSFSPWLLLVVPLCSMIPAVSGWRWLLRPFNPHQILEKDRPLRSRVILAFLFLTAILPLGGLAVPAWIYIRERLWPRLLEEEMSRRFK